MQSPRRSRMASSSSRGKGSSGGEPSVRIDTHGQRCASRTLFPFGIHPLSSPHQFTQVGRVHGVEHPDQVYSRKRIFTLLGEQRRDGARKGNEKQECSHCDACQPCLPDGGEWGAIPALLRALAHPLSLSFRGNNLPNLSEDFVQHDLVSGMEVHGPD